MFHLPFYAYCEYAKVQIVKSDKYKLRKPRLHHTF